MVLVTTTNDHVGAPTAGQHIGTSLRRVRRFHRHDHACDKDPVRFIGKQHVRTVGSGHLITSNPCNDPVRPAKVDRIDRTHAGVYRRQRGQPSCAVKRGKALVANNVIETTCRIAAGKHISRSTRNNHVQTARDGDLVRATHGTIERLHFGDAAEIQEHCGFICQHAVRAARQGNLISRGPGHQIVVAARNVEQIDVTQIRVFTHQTD